MAEQGNNPVAGDLGVAQEGDMAPQAAQLLMGNYPAIGHVMAEMARLKEASDLFVLQHEENKKEARKGKVASALSSIKSAAGKRSVCSKIPFVACSHHCFVRSPSSPKPASCWRTSTRSGSSWARRPWRPAPGWLLSTMWTESTRECFGKVSNIVSLTLFPSAVPSRLKPRCWQI